MTSQLTIGQSYKTFSGLEFRIIRKHSKEDAYLGVCYVPSNHKRPIQELIELRWWFLSTGKYSSGNPNKDYLNHDLILGFRPPVDRVEPSPLRRINIQWVDKFPTSWTKENIEEYILDIIKDGMPQIKLEVVNISPEEVSIPVSPRA